MNLGFSTKQLKALSLQYLSLLISVITVFLIPRKFGFDVSGSFAVYASLQQVIGFAATLGTSSYAIRALGRTTRPKQVITLLYLHAVIMFAVAIIIILVHTIVKSQFNTELGLTVLACWIGLVRYLLEDTTAGLQWYLESGKIPLIENGTRLALIVATPTLQDAGILLILSVSAFTASFYPLTKIVRQRHQYLGSTLHLRYAKEFYRRSLTMFWSHVTALFHSRVGVLLAPRVLAPREVGIFSLLLSIGEFAMRLGGMIARYVYAQSASRTLHAKIKAQGNAIRRMTFFAAGIGFIEVLLFPIYSPMLTSENISAYQSTLIILTLYATIFLYCNLSANIIYGRGRINAVLQSTIIGVIISIVTLGVGWKVRSMQIVAAAMLFGATASALYNARTISNLVARLGRSQ